MTERIQSVDRAIDLLLAVAAAGPADAGVPALAKACGLNRATAWRLLKTLQARRLVTVDEARPLCTGRDRRRAGRGRGAGRRDRGGAPGAGADVRADRRDGVAGVARRRWAHVRRRGHPGRRADGELAGPHRAVARHVDGQGAARVPAARRAAPGAALGAARVHRHHDHRGHGARRGAAATRDRGYGTCAGELESALYGVSARSSTAPAVRSRC